MDDLVVQQSGHRPPLTVAGPGRFRRRVRPVTRQGRLIGHLCGPPPRPHGDQHHHCEQDEAGQVGDRGLRPVPGSGAGGQPQTRVPGQQHGQRRRRSGQRQPGAHQDRRGDHQLPRPPRPGQRRRIRLRPDEHQLRSGYRADREIHQCGTEEPEQDQYRGTAQSADRHDDCRPADATGHAERLRKPLHRDGDVVDDDQPEDHEQGSLERPRPGAAPTVDRYWSSAPRLTCALTPQGPKRDRGGQGHARIITDDRFGKRRPGVPNTGDVTGGLSPRHTQIAPSSTALRLKGRLLGAGGDSAEGSGSPLRFSVGPMAHEPILHSALSGTKPSAAPTRRKP